MRSWNLQLALAAVAAIGVVGWTARAARAADAGPLATYLTDDVTAVGYLDLTKFDAAAAVEEFADLGVANADEIARARDKASMVQKFYDELTRRGARRAFVLVRMTTLSDGGPAWVIEVAGDGDAVKVVELLRQWADAVKANPRMEGPAFLAPAELAIEGNVVLGAATPAQMAKLRESRATAPRADAAEPLEALLAADAGFVAFGDADSRRVVREMFPPLPAPFTEIDGKLLADGLSWFGVLVKLPPGPTVSVTIQAASDAAAHKFEESATNGLGLLKGLALAAIASGETEVASALPALALLEPELNGTRLSITLGDDKEETAAFRAFLAPAMMASREAAQRSQRLSNLKQIALGMFNYESAKGTFPPAAAYDAGGKPLLSWRVLLLPYLEQQGLYKQFHLDEPWDSEHNRALIAKMPNFYMDPGEPGLAAEGRTTIVVPTGPGMVFNGTEGTKLRAITDGTSNTILAVEIVPERAVPWTKPEDWEVDLADPLRGVKRSDAEQRGAVFAAAFCDGHVMTIVDSIEPSAFKAMLTKAAADVFPQ